MKITKIIDHHFFLSFVPFHTIESHNNTVILLFYSVVPFACGMFCFKLYFSFIYSLSKHI